MLKIRSARLTGSGGEPHEPARPLAKKATITVEK